MSGNVRDPKMQRINSKELADAFIEEQIKEIKEQVGDKKVLLALSGGAGGLELLGERLEDARGRTGLADVLFGHVDAVGAPHLDFLVEGGDDAVDGHVARLDAAGQSGDDAGSLHLEHLVAVLELFADGEGLGGLIVLEVFHVGDLRQVEVLGNRGTHLGGVAVDGLTAGDDEVDIHGAQGAGEGAAGGQRIGTAELAVGEQDGAVDTHGEGLAEDGLGLGKTHGDDGDVGTVFVLQLQGVFKAALVVGVHNRGNALADERTGLRVDFHLGGVRHLLYANYNVHCLNFLLFE